MSGDEKIIKCWRYGNGTAFSMRNNIFGGLGALDSDSDSDSDPAPAAAAAPSDQGMGSIVCNIEGAAPFRHFMVSFDDQNIKKTNSNTSGLILAAGDQARMQVSP